MPRAQGVCGTPGCPNLRPCPTHKRTPWEGSTRRRRLPKDWPTRRLRILTRDKHKCQAEARLAMRHDPRCDGTATEVDHVIRGDDHRDENLTSLNHWCHQAKTQAEATAARIGAPR